MPTTQYYGIGRRKTSTARVFLRPGKGDIIVNHRPVEASFPTETLRLVGKHCESGDVLVSEASLPPVGPGDLVCLPATGAYGVSMASNYNGVTRPAVVFVDGGAARVVTRRETYEDLVARDV